MMSVPSSLYRRRFSLTPFVRIPVPDFSFRGEMAYGAFEMIPSYRGRIECRSEGYPLECSDDEKHDMMGCRVVPEHK